MSNFNEIFAVVLNIRNPSGQERIALGYAKYVAEVAYRNALMNTDYTPMPLERFQHKDCAICKKTITDDPYGHNAQPLRDGVCCSFCNESYVLTSRRAQIRDAEYKAELKTFLDEQRKGGK